MVGDEHSQYIYKETGRQKMTNKNKLFCELLGIHWHEWEDNNGLYCHGCSTYFLDAENPNNPDFTTPAGIVKLLGIMEEHPKAKLFFAWLAWGDVPYLECLETDDIDRTYITVPGKLLDAATEFLEGKSNEV